MKKEYECLDCKSIWDKEDLINEPLATKRRVYSLLCPYCNGSDFKIYKVLETWEIEEMYKNGE